mmetsp:Transcript_23944/g.66451  ORF Transcript_23944/g.66451 Transcript_23944/m.66451 type:complete len:405 (-) Transcript_23944:110-1324(-)
MVKVTRPNLGVLGSLNAYNGASSSGAALFGALLSGIALLVGWLPQLLILFPSHDLDNSKLRNSSSNAAAAAAATQYSDQHNYKDCAGVSFAQLYDNFHRDGAILFTPCSLKPEANPAGLAQMDRLLELSRQRCGTSYEGNTCANRIVKDHDKDIRALAANPEILNVLTWLHDGRAAFPFQTLNFMWGTRQPPHSDLIHFAGVPSMTLTAAWVALEDIHADAGPLEYYLGSHKAPFETMQTLNCPLGHYQSCYEEALQQKVLKNPRWRPVSLLAKKGQVVLWDRNVIHGGTPVRNSSLTRTSQVTHYFLEGDDFYIVPKQSVLKFKQDDNDNSDNQVLDVEQSQFAMRPDVAFKAKAEEVLNELWRRPVITAQEFGRLLWNDNMYTWMASTQKLVATNQPVAKMS